MNKNTDFPGVLTVRNPPASAGTWADPWSGKVPHAVGQRNQWAARLGPALHRETAATRGPCSSESSPHSPKREKARTARKTWCSLKLYTVKKKDSKSMGRSKSSSKRGSYSNTILPQEIRKISIK